MSSFEDTTLDEIAQELDAVRKAPRDDVRQMVVEFVGEHGTLTRNMALRLAESTGWSARHLWRWAAEAKQPEPASKKLPVGATFLDRLAQFGPEGFVFDDLAMTLIYMCGGNRRRFREEVLSAGFPMPSEATLSRRWNELPLPEREAVLVGHRRRYQNMLYVRRNAAKAANEAWQVDDFDLDLRVLTELDGEATVDELTGEVSVARGGKWIGVRPHLTLLVDAYSRFIVAWMLLDRTPRSTDVQALFADGFEVRGADVGAGKLGGVPRRIVCDNAGYFLALVKDDTFSSLPVQLRPAPAYSPISKGVVERAGQTIQAMIVTGLAGVVSKAAHVSGRGMFDVPSEHWLEFSQLERICAEVVHRYNYERPHDGIKGAIPAHKYLADNTYPVSATDEQLAEMHLDVARADGVRTVQPTGVHALGQWWMGENLAPFIGKKVRVRQLHHRMTHLAVLDLDGSFIDMVVPSDEVGPDLAQELVEQRKERSHAINIHAAVARAAMERRTADLAAGGDGDMLEAAQEAVAERRRRTGSPSAPPASAPATKRTAAKRKAPAKAPARKAPSKKAPSKKAPGGVQPVAARPPKNTRDISKLPAPTAVRSEGLSVAEKAALDRLANRPRRRK